MTPAVLPTQSLASAAAPAPRDGWLDVVFALAFAALFFGQHIWIEVPTTKTWISLYPSLPLVAFATLAQLARPTSRNSYAGVWSWTFAVFVLMQLASAYRLNVANGLRETTELTVSVSFVLSFAQRYSTVPIKRFLIPFAPLAAAVMIWNIGWHVSKHQYVSWKKLDDPKALFDALPLVTVGYLIQRRGFPWVLGTLMLGLTGLIILLSGERKAYIIFAFAIFLILNPKNPAAYFAPILIIALIYWGVQETGSPYLKRQVATLASYLTGGEGPVSVSDSSRQFQIHLALLLWRLDPVFGLGTNGYISLVQTLYSASKNAVYGVHSEPLRLLVESGLVGEGIFWLMIGTSFGTLFRRRADGLVKTGVEFRIALLWWIASMVYITFEANKFLLEVVELLLPFVGILNFTGQDMPPLGWRGAAQREALRQGIAATMGQAARPAPPRPAARPGGSLPAPG